VWVFSKIKDLKDLTCFFELKKAEIFESLAERKGLSSTELSSSSSPTTSSSCIKGKEVIIEMIIEIDLTTIIIITAVDHLPMIIDHQQELIDQ